MTKADVLCPECSGSKVLKFGLSAESKQRYYCQNSDCKKKTFNSTYTDKKIGQKNDMFFKKHTNARYSYWISDQQARVWSSCINQQV